MQGKDKVDREVIAFLRRLMGNDEEDNKNRLKAAELLGRLLRQENEEKKTQEEDNGLYVIVDYGNDFFPKEKAGELPKKRVNKAKKTVAGKDKTCKEKQGMEKQKTTKPGQDEHR